MGFRYGTEFLNRALFAFLLMGLLTSSGNSQTTTSVTETSSAEERATPKDGALKDEAQNKSTCGGSVLCIAEKIDSLRLSPTGRFARGLQYQFELTEQPGTVFISQGTGVGEVSAFLRNPQKYLQKHTLTFKFAELFPDRLSLYKRGSEYLKKHPEAANEQLSDILCSDNPLITCLTNGGSWWKRALMGTTINVYFSQRALVQQQFLATSSQFGKDFLVNGGFTFDPAKLFPTASNWKSTFDDVQNIDKGLALLAASDYEKKPWKHSWAVALIPKVEFKILSQFDFLKYQGALIDPPFPNPALSTWTFTWDLTRAIPDTKSRADADAIAEAVDNLKNTLGTEPQSTWKKQCLLHFDQGVVRKVKDLHPAFTASSCQELGRVMKAKQYQLACVLVDKDGAEKEREDGLVTELDTPPKPGSNSCHW